MKPPGTAFDWKISDLLGQLHGAYQQHELTTEWGLEEAANRLALEKLRDLLHRQFTPRRVVDVGGSGVILQLEDRMTCPQ